MRSPPSVATGLFAGRYAIEREIGQGASAIVYLARDTRAGSAVALKILRPELAESRASDRFLREIKRTSGLQHPNILPVLDAGEHEGQLYFALPYMEGGSLRQLLKREKHLELSRVLEISRTVAEALDYAHERGLIHRDVKPENILFTGGRACLGDFGIARAIDLSGTGGTSTTSRSMVRGTPAYMSPEQAAGSQELDGRSDVFSLACVIYEMITGMQAYIGPTDEAVIAMRFMHPPRDLRVYRPTVPVVLNDALQKAFAVTVADRYRTASEMVDAVAKALATHTSVEREATPVPPKVSAERRAFFPVVSGLVGIAAVVWAMIPTQPPVTSDLNDTTRLVLLPIERAGPEAASWRDEDLLHQAFARWRDIKVVDQFQVADAIRRFGTVEGASEARRIAESLGAGRYVRARLTPLGVGWRLSASVYDMNAARPLYQTFEAIPGDISGAIGAYARVADTLLLRGVRADSVRATAIGTRSLPAVQAFGRGLEALDDWDLAAADSAFQAAALFDPQYARAHLWLAQTRAWQARTTDAWGTVAERASVMSEQLNERERRLARALVHLARRSYDEACAEYRALAGRNDRDFAAWYGQGQCETMNTAVVADSTSPSGWRFRMSADRAMRAYAKAFDVLPSVHRGYERGAFERLRVLLLLSEQLFQGYGADSSLFYGRLGFVKDTLVLVPYPWRSMGRASTPPGAEPARRERRMEFRRIVRGWSTAFPRSAGAKRAVAHALELLGDPAAIDTMRLARKLAADRPRRLELAVEEVLLLVKFGIPDRPDLITRARTLSDSLFSEARDLSADEARSLVPAAALLGRCGMVNSLARQGTPPTGRLSTSSQLLLEAEIHLIHVVLGCPVEAPIVSLRGLATMITAEQTRRGNEASAHLDANLLYRPALLAMDADILARVQRSRKALVISAALYAARNEHQRARVALDSSDRAAITRPTPDVGLAKARLWLVLGDTARSAQVLDQVFGAGLSELDPRSLRFAGVAASLSAAIALRADVAHATRDSAARRRWAAIAVELLGSADASVQPITERMRRYLARN